MAAFDFSQVFRGRVITDPTLARFIWENHNFGTSYREPFVHSTVKSNSSQSYIFSESIKPVRIFELEFSTLFYNGNEETNCPDELNYSKLQAFYLTHGLHKAFIYPHPVYGDLKVRFAKPIVLPKKNPNSRSIQGFTLTLIEIIDTDFFFDPTENLTGDIDFPCGFYDVEIEYNEDTVAAPLGGSYSMIFRDNKPPIRSIKMSIEGLKYFTTPCGALTLSYAPQNNAALLEIFYLQKRLKRVFNMEYAGEIIPVRFKEPLNLTKPMANSGVLPTIEIQLIETPFTELSKGDINELGY